VTAAPGVRVRAVVAASSVAAAAMILLLATAPPAKAICEYPSVGVAVNVGGISGFFCDFPTEINGSHMHCQAGGIALGLGGVFTTLGNGGNAGGVVAGQGINGASCNWRCPDGTDAPAPNPPGMWREYLVPMNTTNFCRDHMTPNGFWSDPVLPTEGIPPAGEQQPQSAPQPLPHGPPAEEQPGPSQIPGPLASAAGGP